MKIALTDGGGKVWLDEVPLPDIGDYECLCRIDACATCTGTDKKLISGTMSWATPDKYPAVLGHESVGTVIKLGKKVRHIAEGDRFLRPAAWYSGTRKHGITSFMGGFAEYGIVTDIQALKEDAPDADYEYYCNYQQFIPPDLEVSDIDATMLITLKEIYSVIRDLEISSQDKVLILGAGTVGCSMAYFARRAGAAVAVAARRECQLELCRKAGAELTVNVSEKELSAAVRAWAPEGVTHILDAAGAAELMIPASGALAEEGAICSYAGGNVMVANFHKLNLPIRWKFISFPPKEATAHDDLIQMVRNREIPFELFYGEVLPLEKFTEGIARIFDKISQKTVFTMEHRK